MQQRFAFIPTFILKHKFETNEYLKICEMPITLFHGTRDNVINYESSVRLKDDFKNKVTLITLKGQGHNGITDNNYYIEELKNILRK